MPRHGTQKSPKEAVHVHYQLGNPRRIMPEKHPETGTKTLCFPSVYLFEDLLPMLAKALWLWMLS